MFTPRYVPKHHKLVVSVLQENNFYLNGMRNFNLQAICTKISEASAFNEFTEEIGHTKMTHFLLTKTILIVLYLFQHNNAI